MRRRRTTERSSSHALVRAYLDGRGKHGGGDVEARCKVRVDQLVPARGKQTSTPNFEWIRVDREMFIVPATGVDDNRGRRGQRRPANEGPGGKLARRSPRFIDNGNPWEVQGPNGHAPLAGVPDRE